MDAAIKVIQIFRLAMLVSIVLYAAVAQLVPTTVVPNPVILFALTGLAVTMVLLVFVMRRVLVLRAEAMLASKPDDAKALNTWRSGYIVTYALSEGIALYGVVLHFLGFTLSMVAPFFLAGFVLLLFFPARRPSNAVG